MEAVLDMQVLVVEVVMLNGGEVGKTYGSIDIPVLLGGSSGGAVKLVVVPVVVERLN